MDSKYQDFEDVIVTKNQPTYADLGDDNIHYNVYCVIDGKKYFGGDLDWGIVRDSIINIIRMSGIKNSINIYLRFSDEK